MKEADNIFVLDTGSSDNTVKLLKENGAIVKETEIKPWRFDIARNLILNMIPTDFDILVCTDLDEIFNIGWRNELERVWKKNTNKLRYIYNWSLDKNNNPMISFYGEKIHDRNYIWINPVHEILEFKNYNENIITTDNIVLNHYPDLQKSRNSYLPLLELSVKEDKNNDRNMHYLGREYMYYKKWNKCIDTLINHLNLPTATWKDERCASMRYISRSYIALKRYEEAKMWLVKAIKEAPYLREPYIENALLEYKLNNFKEVKKNCLKALKITNFNKTYINEPFSHDNTIYDLLSISYYYEKKFNTSLKYAKKASKMNPSDERIKKNIIIIKEQIKALNI